MQTANSAALPAIRPDRSTYATTFPSSTIIVGFASRAADLGHLRRLLTSLRDKGRLPPGRVASICWMDAAITGPPTSTQRSQAPISLSKLGETH